MSYASLITTLEEQPTTVTSDGKEYLQASSLTNDNQKLRVLLRCAHDSSCAKQFKDTLKDALLIGSGDLLLEDEGKTPVLLLRSVSKAYPDQFLNEVSITGRLSGSIKEADKSCSSSIAVNRMKGNEEAPDWFRIRCFGVNRERLQQAPKGALVTASGILEQRVSSKQEPYVEVKTRVLRFHAKPGSYNPSEGKEAAGYAQSDFEGADAPPMPADWV